MYKMVLKITKETLENNGIEVIIDSVKTLSLNETNIEKKLLTEILIMKLKDKKHKKKNLIVY